MKLRSSKPEAHPGAFPAGHSADWHADRAAALAKVALPLHSTTDRQLAATMAVYHALVALRLDARPPAVTVELGNTG